MTNTVRPESGRPDSIRNDHRVTIPLTVVIEGRSHAVQNWSLGGFRVANHGDRMRLGEELVGHLVLPYQAFALQLEVRFRVVRVTQGDVGCEFIDLPRAARRALRHLLEAAMEGRLDDVESVLGFVDAPVPTGKLEELLEEEDETHIQVGRRRLIRKSTLYLGLGAIALLVSLLMLSRNMAFIDVPAGTVMGNFVSVASRVDGRLADLWVEEGKAIQAGEPLFALSNKDLEEGTAMAKAGLDAARIRYEALEQELSAELDRLDFYQRISVSQRKATEAGLREAQAHLDQATVTRKRFEKLRDQGLLPQDRYEEAVEEEKVLKERRDALAQRVKIANLNVEGSTRGYFFGGTEIEGRVVEVREALRVAGAETAEAKRALSQAMTRQEETRVRSPVAGTVYTIYRHKGEVLHARDSVMSIRTDDGYWATARLAEDEVVRVRPGQSATVVIPSYGLRLKGLVTAVGHQGLSTASQSSADMETSLKEVPLKIQLLDPPLGLPPGIRARIRIQTGSTRLAWLWGADREEEAPRAPLIPSPTKEAPPVDENTEMAAVGTDGGGRSSRAGRAHHPDRSPAAGGSRLRPVPVSLPLVPVEVPITDELPASDDDLTSGPAGHHVEPLPNRRVKAPEARVTTPAEPVVARSAAGDAIQLGAFGSEAGAWHYADEVASAALRLPDGADYYLRPMDRRDPDSLVRLLVGPLGSTAAGTDLCARFRAAGRDCIVRSADWLSAQP